MAKQKITQQKLVRKPTRHHWFLISIFMVIIILSITAFILQRSINIKAIAGEAIKQRVAETKQLALTEEEAKVATAIELGEKEIIEKCPSSLNPSIQSWVLEGNWKLKELQAVEVKCSDNIITCYYADDESEINRADQVVIYNVIPKVKDCEKEKSANILGCKCQIS